MSVHSPTVVGEQRTERLDIRIAPSELAMLKALAEAEGLSQADIVRQCVRARYAARFGDKPPKKTGPARR